MNAKERRDKIRQEKIGAQDKRVLLVEGTDDQLTLVILLSRLMPEWEKTWTVETAGKKSMVSEILRLEPTWLGLVDRDEWDADEQHRQTAQLPNLLILPRFCMENYLIVPGELWGAIPANRRAQVEGGQPAFEQRLLGRLPRYVRHGVLWHVITPLWSGLRALGFKESLASDSLQCVDAVQDDASIQRVLTDWDRLLDPTALFAKFEQKLGEVDQLSFEVKLRNWVHGKTFWREEVNPAMNELLGQMAEKTRRQKIWQKIGAPPPDLEFLFARLRARP
jgi:hypothetical protein